ncbi:MAG: CinA family protein [Deltaproteobacteria bacterium]|nr:CinA family protein [Deltaproteobacteria bacterium]
MSFLTDEQKDLAKEIAALLTERGETVCVAESTTGGLVSAALLWVAGASKYYAGGGVLYTLASRTALADVPASMFENYRGSTPEMIAAIAEGMRKRLGATWCIAESGLAGPTSGRSGLPPGRTTVGVSGPVTRVDVQQTRLPARESNMVAFTTLTLRYLRDAIKDAQ